MITQDYAVPHTHAHPDSLREEMDPTPRTVDWNNPRVAAILEAAAKCFSRKGFSATTLAEIGKELGLRKSIVHYYFASKAALIHEVQSYTYHKYLERVRDAVRSELGPGERSAKGIHALWDAAGDGNVGLNIEVWSASRNDEELKRRASALQKEKRKLVAQSIADMLGADPSRIRESLCTLVLSVLNGLTVCEYVEGDAARPQEAFDIFVSLLRAGLQNLDTPQPQAVPQVSPTLPSSLPPQADVMHPGIPMPIPAHAAMPQGAAIPQGTPMGLHAPAIGLPGQPLHQHAPTVHAQPQHAQPQPGMPPHGLPHPHG